VASSTFDLLALALAPGLSPRGARELLARGPLADSLARPRDHADLLDRATVAAIESGALAACAERELEAARRLSVDVIGLGEDRYPLWLRTTHTPPLVLWCRGTLVDTGAASVAIVGSRAATPLGQAFARRLAEALASAGLEVVSGLARGIDAAAHRGALAAGGRTLAVLGSGLDRLYPPEHDRLADEVAASGALLSEFPLGTRPWKAHFPRRNRVIAGLARGVVVVEASGRSGALSTARAALDEGREVMAVPGHPAQPQAEGTNGLLRDGAALVRGPADVLDAPGIETPATPLRAPEDAVLRALGEGVPRGVDELQERTGLAVPALLARLAALELEGALRRVPGALYVSGRAASGYTRGR
jgi:DNA processing protein